MPAPATPGGFTITEVLPNSGVQELEWTHAGAHRFEVLRKESGQTSWFSEIIAPAADFGPGPYTYTTIGSATTTFVVRALNADGEVSV